MIFGGSSSRENEKIRFNSIALWFAAWINACSEDGSLDVGGSGDIL